MLSEYLKASATASALVPLAVWQPYLLFHYVVLSCLVSQIHGSGRVKRCVVAINQFVHHLVIIAHYISQVVCVQALVSLFQNSSTAVSKLLSRSRILVPMMRDCIVHPKLLHLVSAAGALFCCRNALQPSLNKYLTFLLSWFFWPRCSDFHKQRGHICFILRHVSVSDRQAARHSACCLQVCRETCFGARVRRMRCHCSSCNSEVLTPQLTGTACGTVACF
jgi:hypothetical protein